MCREWTKDNIREVQVEEDLDLRHDALELEEAQDAQRARDFDDSK